MWYTELGPGIHFAHLTLLPATPLDFSSGSTFLNIDDSGPLSQVSGNPQWSSLFVFGVHSPPVLMNDCIVSVAELRALCTIYFLFIFVFHNDTRAWDRIMKHQLKHLLFSNDLFRFYKLELLLLICGVVKEHWCHDCNKSSHPNMSLLLWLPVYVQ